jgi:hypothetical protein
MVVRTGGIMPTAQTYGAVVMVLAVLALVALLRTSATGRRVR